MANNGSGRFSKNLLSVKLQIQSLFEDVGGDNAIALLDSLCALTATEQKVALKVMKRVIDRLAQEEPRLLSPNEQRMQDLEDFIVSDIVRELSGETDSTEKSSKLSLVPGGKLHGKAVGPKTSLKLSSNPLRKESHLKPVLN